MFDGRHGSYGYIPRRAVLIYKAHLMAGAVSLPEHMLVPYVTKALSHIIHVRNDEPDSLNEPQLDYSTHKAEECVRNNARLST